ncbi:hypothetical protein [Chryseobacterium sp. NKUCC03_KSP]|uniref:hypothetical protein n=1 Tax=Chryseobacterium sp. NKUCC03_KSP TaxID=2842125 RepID=UPI001C5AE15C|nr:hypothetical protein [Chryseobacterium sp. NKUCC03_KSP]MBW3524315.1 hypothetical protein [Chryseobacterium sp. NKUCC03_KSP]
MKYFEKRIKNFTIIQNKSKLIINYRKTAKDWFDSVIILFIGLFLSVATYFLISQGIKATSFISIGGGLVFAFQAFVQSTSGIFRILQSSKKILVIDRDSKTLTSKKNFFISKTFPLESIEAITASGQKEKVFTSGGNSMKRTYCTVTVKLKDKTSEELFIINTHRFFQTSSNKLETELYIQAKHLTTELNKYLK